MDDADFHGPTLMDEDCVEFSEDIDRRVALGKLLGMGFAPEESRCALTEAGGNIEAAIALLAQALLAQSAAASAQTRDEVTSAKTPLRVTGGEDMSGPWSAADVDDESQHPTGDLRSPQAEVDDEEALLIEGDWTKVRALRPGLKSVNLVVIVLEAVGSPIQTAQGSTVQTWLVADETGAVELTLYNEHASAFAEGAILRLLEGYSSLYRDVLRLYVGTSGGTLRQIGDFTMRYAPFPNLSLRPTGAMVGKGKGKGKGKG